MKKKILTLTIKRKWFLMIALGYKLEEYREIKKHYDQLKLMTAGYTHLRLRNGYQKKAPELLVEIEGIKKGKPALNWVDSQFAEQDFYVIRLGKVLMLKNCLKLAPWLCTLRIGDDVEILTPLHKGQKATVINKKDGVSLQLRINGDTKRIKKFRHELKVIEVPDAYNYKLKEQGILVQWENKVPGAPTYMDYYYKVLL